MLPFECGPPPREDDRSDDARLDERGELTRILREELDPAEAHAVYPAGRRPSAKVRGFSNYLAAQLAGSTK